MGIEIERKFLIKKDLDWKPDHGGIRYIQGYLPSANLTTVRIRIAGEKAFLTIKSKTEGASRMEFEYEIPVNDAKTMLAKLCTGPLIDKTRYVLKIDDLTWEVDVFYGDNEGLILAEVELNSEDQHFKRPSWIDKEVTTDVRYYNVNLSQNPYKNWKSET
ncbi:CYTH domain-containing protein [Deltaproteobacteria bacterium TL4]